MTIYQNVRLKDFAYYGTGGVCAVLYAPSNLEELADYVKTARRLNQPLIPLGGGTNSLVLDERFNGAFIVFRHLAELLVTGDRVQVGAGVDNSLLAETTYQYGLAGAAWMYRLPGQVGGTVRMNARCYGGEISQIVRQVTAVGRDGEIRTYTDPAMFRGYKDTIFMHSGDLIASVELQLSPGDPATILSEMQACGKDRQSKGQFNYPSCGCVFKNDYAVGVPSGLLLQEVGAKNLSHHGAEVSHHHANFVYNKGASSRSILELTLKMRELVYQEFGVWLAYEMEILGTLPADLASQVLAQKEQHVDQAKIDALKEKARKAAYMVSQ